MKHEPDIELWQPVGHAGKGERNTQACRHDEHRPHGCDQDERGFGKMATQLAGVDPEKRQDQQGENRFRTEI